MFPDLPASLFTAEQMIQLRDIVEIDPKRSYTDLSMVEPDHLAQVEILITGWGAPALTSAMFAQMPRLGAVAHTAGSVKGLLAAAAWPTGVQVTSAVRANAIPVAEYTLGHILLAGKRTLAFEADYRRRRQLEADWYTRTGYGNYGAVVGLIGASHIGRLVADYLRGFDVEVLIYDPFIDSATVAGLGATQVDLEDLFRRSDVVSLHAPDVPATTGMVDATALALMRDGATFINTARPALVDEDALRRELLSGRLNAVLDVHDSLPQDDPLWQLPTVSITPHIAGSQGNELHRLASAAIDDVAAYAAGRAPVHPVDLSALGHIA